ncbi:MAG: MoaD family protein [Spongiibacteraceae bacterium]
MLNVLFFASVREQLGVEGLSCAPAKNIDELISALVAEHGIDWEKILRAPNIIVAVNHEVVSLDFELHDGDEVAFFPPVTGG